MSEIPDLSKKYNIPLAAIKQQVDADTKLASALSQNDTALGFLLINDKLSHHSLPAKSSVLWKNTDQANSQINQFSGAIVNISSSCKMLQQVPVLLMRTATKMALFEKQRLLTE